KVLITLGLALPLAISCSSPPLSMGARQPVSTVFWATAVISFSPLEIGYRTVCFLHEACQPPGFLKSEAMERLRLACPGSDQPGAAQTECSCCTEAIILGAMNKRLDDFRVVRFTETHEQSGQISREEEISAGRRR